MPLSKQKLCASLLRVLAGVPTVGMLALGVLFVLFSTTVMGRLVGLSATILGGLSYCSIGYWNSPWFKTRRKMVLATMLPFGMASYLLPMALAPDGSGAMDRHVRHRFLDSRGTFRRYSPWNVIPEVDQVMVGMHVMALGDPYIDFTKARRMRSLTAPAYGELEQDPDFRDLGSVMGMAYRELFRMEFRTGHYYLFLPEDLRDERLPCLIYLHGMGGNRKSHFWVMSQVSKHIRCAVIAPSFGMGNWDRPGGGQLAVDVAREAIDTLPVDANRIYLLGYSNGAKGVTRAVVAAPELFRGLIYLSPVTEDEFFSSPEFLSQRSRRRMLFLHGGQDRRISLDVVKSTVAYLKLLGCDIRANYDLEEDHYLVMSQSNQIIGEIADFIRADEAAEEPVRMD